MRLVSLNTLAGYFLEPLLEFTRDEAPKTDFFCFQEVMNTKLEGDVESGYRPNLFAKLQKTLPDFQGFFTFSHPNHELSVAAPYNGENVQYGVAIFVRRNYAVSKEGNFYIYKDLSSYREGEPTSYPHSFQYIQTEINGKKLTVGNFYGTPRPGDKLDTPDRLEQSKKVLEFLQAQEGGKVFAGDMNLLPETESVKMFERAGFRNLVKDFEIKTTRGTLVKHMYPEYGQTEQGFQEFADFAFTSPGLAPTSFEVPDNGISDHLPLILDFKL